MLRGGKVVALDTTAALINRISGSQLEVRLSGAGVPASLAPLLAHPQEPGSNKAVFRIAEYTDVEPILASLRLSGALIEDMQLHQADLEDVFIEIMEGNK
jgi:ABC-2 type transport system ATP-binding protein